MREHDNPIGARRAAGLALALASVGIFVGCNEGPTSEGSAAWFRFRPLDPSLVAEGKQIFRHDTYGNEVFWTDTARMHEVIASAVSPNVALSVVYR